MVLRISPYLVETAEQLNGVRDHLGAHFKQTANIDMAAYNDGVNWIPIGSFEDRFTGVYDGNGYKITNLVVDRPDWNYIGLFGTIEGATLRNISLENAYVKGYDNAVILAGGNWGTITNCHFEGEISGYSVGGLVGISFGTIKNCSANIIVTGEGMVGGMVGTNDGPVINSFVKGDVSGTGQVGGMVGWQNADTIINSFSKADVSAERGNAGGIEAFNLSGHVRNCYSGGKVGRANYFGGLIAINHEGKVLNSYYDKETTDQSDTDRGVPKSTAEMKQEATYEGWDFEEIWFIEEGETYPYHKGI